MKREGSNDARKGEVSKPTYGLGKSVYIFVPCAQIWLFIMRYIIDVVLLYECSVDDPRSIRDDLVHPTTMSDCFAAFCVVHNTLELIVFDLFVVVHTNEEVHIRERKLCLAQLQGVAETLLSVSPG